MSNNSPMASNTLLARALLLAGLFLTAVVGAWAWYNVNPRRFDTMYEFSATNQVRNLSFESIPVDETSRETLATTNLVNGVFRFHGEPKFMAFLATWNAADSKQMGVVAHTPDICWVGAGMVPVSLGQPRVTNFVLGNVSLPFEVRAFRAPSNPRPELTVWCTLVSGQVFEESDRFEPPKVSATSGAGVASGNNDALMQQAANSRSRSGGQFIRVVRERIAGNGSKQFVRFSTPVEAEWSKSLQELQRFAAEWIQVQVSHPADAEPGRPR